MRALPLTLTLTPGVRLPSRGARITLAAAKRIRKSGAISATRFIDGRVSLYSRVTVVGVGVPLAWAMPVELWLVRT